CRKNGPTGRNSLSWSAFRMLTRARIAAIGMGPSPGLAATAIVPNVWRNGLLKRARLFLKRLFKATPGRFLFQRRNRLRQIFVIVDGIVDLRRNSKPSPFRIAKSIPGHLDPELVIKTKLLGVNFSATWLALELQGQG